MNTNELIDKLSVDVKPVTSLTRWTLAVTVTSIFAVGILLFFTLANHAIELAVITFVSSLTLSRLAVPGRSDYRFWAVSALLFWVSTVGILTGQSYLREPFSADTSGLQCTLSALLFSAPPILFWFLVLRRGAVTRPVLTGALVGFVGACHATIALNLCCPHQLNWHVLEWHLLVPVAAATAVGAVVGKSALRW